MTEEQRRLKALIAGIVLAICIVVVIIERM